jgi:hypothetical protein
VGSMKSVRLDLPPFVKHTRTVHSKPSCGVAVHSRGVRPSRRPSSQRGLTCTYSGRRLTALLMAHTLNCTSVSSAVALLLNLQGAHEAVNKAHAWLAHMHLPCLTTAVTCGSAQHSTRRPWQHTTPGSTQPIQPQHSWSTHGCLTHLSASTIAPRLPGSPALCSRSRSLKALPSTRVRWDSCSSCRQQCSTAQASGCRKASPASRQAHVGSINSTVSVSACTAMLC